MHYILTSYTVSDTNENPKVLYVAQYLSYIETVAPTATAGGPVHVSFVSNPWAREVLRRTLLS